MLVTLIIILIDGETYARLSLKKKAAINAAFPLSYSLINVTST